MRRRLHPGLLVAAVVAMCCLVVLAAVFLRSRLHSNTASLIARFPPGDAVIMSVDVGALRRSGVLASIAGSKAGEEPEYRTFVLETGFDYQRDLDSALVAFQDKATYFLLRGRFNWDLLRAYVAAQDGVCRNTFCRMKGSTAERNISFFPLAPDLMALAVSADDWAAARLMYRQPGRTSPAFPNRPVWLHIPAAFLKNEEKLPAGTRLFAKAMEGARSVVLSLGPQDGRFEAVLDVTCGSPREAEHLSAQLEAITRLLRDLLDREKKAPNPADLSGVLAAGTFRSAQERVEGRWPVERAFLENLAGTSF